MAITNKNLLNITMGIGLDALFNGEVEYENFKAYMEIAKDFFEIYSASEEAKAEYISELERLNEYPSRVFLNNMKAVLISKSFEQLETI